MNEEFLRALKSWNDFVARMSEISRVQKLEPRKPREFWIHKGLYSAEDTRWAVEDDPKMNCCNAIHVREVIE